jgi:hypothetical protein
VIDRVFHHYELWEDWRAGFYRDVEPYEVNELIGSACSLLSDSERLRRSMMRVVRQWPFSAEVNLTNLGCNRQAWLGQAACCIELGVPEQLTRQAWGLLLESHRVRANAVADSVINLWVGERTECQNDLWG